MNAPQIPTRRERFRHRTPWIALGIVVLAVMALRVFLSPPLESSDHLTADGSAPGSRSSPSAQLTTDAQPRVSELTSRRTAPVSPEAIVARKQTQFAQSRRRLAAALAQRKGIEIPSEVEQFFDAMEGGNWEEIHAAFERINGGDSSASHAHERDPRVSQLWPAIIDAFGVAEQVHEWPAKELLEYGEAILGTLKPGMVYVGGTDNGRWIPELLNDTSDGQRHIVVTQNGLADTSYLDYVQLQYGDRLQVPSADDAARIFSEFTAEAQIRLKHDEEHPDAPKQVRPGEVLEWKDGSLNVSGPTAVMAINEKLLLKLIELNPDLSFGLQESFPLRNTYGQALPLGPIMELNARGDDAPFTPERATASVDHWTAAAGRVLESSLGQPSDSALKSYSHDATAAANLLASQDFTTQAEQAYRAGMKLWPSGPEPIVGLANLLGASGRLNEATQLLDTFRQNHPDQVKFLDQLELSENLRKPPPKP